MSESNKRVPKREHRIQIAAKTWLDVALPSSVIWSAVDHAIPMSGVEKSRAMFQWQRLKSRGVKRGIPDFHFWWRGIYLAVELKVNGGAISPDERAWLAALEREGFLAKVARSVADLERHLREAGFPVNASAKGIDERLAMEPPKKAAKRVSKPRQSPPTKRALRIGAGFHRP